MLLTTGFIIGKMITGQDSMDKFEQCASESSLCIGILANPHNHDFQLIDADVAIPEDVKGRYVARGLEFLGLIGLANGEVRTVLNDEPSEAMSAAIFQEFQRLYGRAIEQLESQTMGDSLEFLEKLHRL